MNRKLFAFRPDDVTLADLMSTTIALGYLPEQVSFHWFFDADDQEWFYLWAEGSPEGIKPELHASLHRPERPALEAGTELAVPDVLSEPESESVSASPVKGELWLCVEPGCTFKGATKGGMRSHFARMHKKKPVTKWGSREPMLACADCDFLTSTAPLMHGHTNAFHQRNPNDAERTPLIPEERAERMITEPGDAAPAPGDD